MDGDDLCDNICRFHLTEQHLALFLPKRVTMNGTDSRIAHTPALCGSAPVGGSRFFFVCFDSSERDCGAAVICSQHKLWYYYQSNNTIKQVKQLVKGSAQI